MSGNETQSRASPPIQDGGVGAVRSFAVAFTLSSIMAQLARGGFVPLFANRMGFSVVLIGVLIAVIQLASVGQIWAARHMDRFGCKRLMLRTWAWSPLLLVPAILAPQIGHWTREWAATACVFIGLTGFAVLNLAGAAALMPLLRENLPPAKSTELVGKIVQVALVASFLGSLCFSFFLGEDPPVWRFQALFVFAAVLAGTRVLFLQKVRDVEPIELEAGQTLTRDLGKIWRDVPFRRMLVFVAISCGAVGLIIPFRPLFIKALGFSDRFAVMVTVSVALCALGLTFRMWGRLADRYGSRGLYALGGIGVTLSPIILCLARGNDFTSGAWLVLAMTVGAAFWGAYEAGHIRRLFTIVPRRNQSLYMVLCGIVGFAFLALGSFLGGLILAALRTVLPMVSGNGWLGPGADYRVLFLLAAGANTVAVLYARRMRELKEISTSRLLLRLRLRALRWFLSGRTGLYLWRGRDRDER